MEYRKKVLKAQEELPRQGTLSFDHRCTRGTETPFPRSSTTIRVPRDRGAGSAFWIPEKSFPGGGEYNTTTRQEKDRTKHTIGMEGVVIKRSMTPREV